MWARLPFLCIQHKDLYQAQETQKKQCEFSTVWAEQADLSVLKISEILLKYIQYPTFEGGFSIFPWAKQVQNQRFAENYVQCLHQKVDQYTAMNILGIAQPKHWILLEVSKDLGENLMLNGLLVLSTSIYFCLSIFCFA